MSRVARLRCGNTENANKYWLSDDKKLCRVCSRETETLEHMTERCEAELRWSEGIDSLLGEEGRGAVWCDRLEKRRKEVGRLRAAEWEQKGRGDGHRCESRRVELSLAGTRGNGVGREGGEQR